MPISEMRLDLRSLVEYTFASVNECDHILTIQLRLSVGAATAEWHLDTRGQVKSERHSERVEYTSDDEWELQAGLGRAIVRGVRRKLGELAPCPVPADAEARRSVRPVICYPVEGLARPDLAPYRAARVGWRKVSEVVVPPREARCFAVAAGQFFRIVSMVLRTKSPSQQPSSGVPPN